MAERRMLLNKNDTFIPHLIISYDYESYNYDTVDIINDDNIEYKIIGENNYGIIEIMFKNEFVLYHYSIDFIYNIKNITIQNETNNIIILNTYCITTDGFIEACNTYGKFKFKNYFINSEETANMNIYGSNCIFENYAFERNVIAVIYYDNFTPITIIVKDLHIYAYPHILYDLMKYNGIEESDEKAKNYNMLYKNRLIISSPTDNITRTPNVDLGDNNYIQSVNNYI